MESERTPWLAEAIKKKYKTLTEWRIALKELGMDYPLTTINGWERSGFLPTSLDYKSFNIVCESLGMTANEVAQKQGLKIVERLGDIEVPDIAIDFVKKLSKVNSNILATVLPSLETYFGYLCTQAENIADKDKK
jgi:hypothetical protein